MAKKAPLDTTIEVVTPENIAFEYQLAGPFRRLPAFLIDVFLRVGIFVLLLVAIAIIGGFFTVIFGGSALPALLVFVLLLSFFILSWFYGIFF